MQIALKLHLVHLLGSVLLPFLIWCVSKGASAAFCLCTCLPLLLAVIILSSSNFLPIGSGSILFTEKKKSDEVQNSIYSFPKINPKALFLVTLKYQPNCWIIVKCFGSRILCWWFQLCCCLSQPCYFSTSLFFSVLAKWFSQNVRG